MINARNCSLSRINGGELLAKSDEWWEANVKDWITCTSTQQEGGDKEMKIWENKKSKRKSATAPQSEFTHKALVRYMNQ